MSKDKVNSLVLKKQYKQLLSIFSIVLCLVVAICVLFMDPSDGSSQPSNQQHPDLTGGPIDESFTEANSESAISSIQMEAKDTSQSVKKTADRVQALEISTDEKLNELKKQLGDALKKLSEKQEKENAMQMDVTNKELWRSDNQIRFSNEVPEAPKKLEVAHYTWAYHSDEKGSYFKNNPRNYVPSSTYAKAIVLVGADSDASVNGQNSTTPMILKILDNGSLPNGGTSRISGCRLITSSYGDVSSERAFARIEHISCRKKGIGLIDKNVSGWVVYRGKVGIKGKLTMRDGEVLKWAGISGALSGFAGVAQASQSVQSISPLGSTTTIPSGDVFAAGAYAGTANAMERLANYYIKRADQYHPIVQVGAGNIVEVVFKEGFYLEPNDSPKETYEEPYRHHDVNNKEDDPKYFNAKTFQVSPALLREMDSANKASRGAK